MRSRFSNLKPQTFRLPTPVHTPAVVFVLSTKTTAGRSAGGRRGKAWGLRCEDSTRQQGLVERAPHGSGSSITGQPSLTGYLYLDVWDAGQHTSATIEIFVNQCGYQGGMLIRDEVSIRRLPWRPNCAVDRAGLMAWLLILSILPAHPMAAQERTPIDDEIVQRERHRAMLPNLAVLTSRDSVELAQLPGTEHGCVAATSRSTFRHRAGQEFPSRVTPNAAAAADPAPRGTQPRSCPELPPFLPPPTV